MPATFSCRCSDPPLGAPGATGCARCGGERLNPILVWGSELPRADRPPPRTDPPRHAETLAHDFYHRVAIQSGSGRRRRRRFHGRGIAAGLVLLAAAALVGHSDCDVALLRLGSIALGAFGLVSLLKGLLGHGAGR